MAIEVFLAHIVVVVLPVLRTGVVRWIDIYDVDLAAMREGERFQDVEVFAIDHGVKRLVAAAFDFSSAHKAGIDVVLELRDDYEVLSGNLFSVSLSLILSRCQMARSHAIDRFHTQDSPKSLIAFRV